MNHTVPPAATPAPDQAHPARDRAAVSLVCEVRQGIRPWRKVRLKDISRAGFRLAWFPNVDMRQPLRIRIPGMELLTAHVRWAADHSLGCEFTAPLHAAVLDHIVRSALAQDIAGR